MIISKGEPCCFGLQQLKEEVWGNFKGMAFNLRVEKPSGCLLAKIYEASFFFLG